MRAQKFAGLEIALICGKFNHKFPLKTKIALFVVKGGFHYFVTVPDTVGENLCLPLGEPAPDELPIAPNKKASRLST